jgi:nucleoside-diphosphate-sugar epimerase
VAVTGSEGFIGSRHVIPALTKKCIDARERGDAFIEARGIVLAAERYDGRDPVNLVAGTGFEDGLRATIEWYERPRTGSAR